VTPNLKAIAKLPNERALWWVRQLYKLPPTDPRFLAMTPEMILLEQEHYLLDHPELGKKESYADPDYEEWEKKTIEEDRKLSIPGESERPDEIDGGAKPKSKVEKNFEDEWEEVE
jgi:hypothetical protein